jgi:peptidoglycan/xylan/chitin deacetylase (PgdA/CDA1 family)
MTTAARSARAHSRCSWRADDTYVGCAPAGFVTEGNAHDLRIRAVPLSSSREGLSFEAAWGALVRMGRRFVIEHPESRCVRGNGYKNLMDRRQFLALVAGGAFGNLTGMTVASSDRGRCGPGRLQPAIEHVKGEGSGVQRIVWSVDTERPLCALTFDDGPDPEFTPRILEILEQQDVKASFLVMGYNASRHARLLKEIVRAGHDIGSHTWSHITLPTATPQEVRAEIERGTRVVENWAGAKVRFFRPPHGRLTEAAVRATADLGQDIVLWSVTRGELGLREPERVASHVAGTVRPGDIVDLHDGIGRGTFKPESEFAGRLRRRRAMEVEALPQILKGIRTKGLRLVTLSQLIAAWRPDDSPPSIRHQIIDGGTAP